MGAGALEDGGHAERLVIYRLRSHHPLIDDRGEAVGRMLGHAARLVFAGCIVTLL